MGLFRRTPQQPHIACASRKEMDDALRAAFDQHLRPQGFTGSLPHFRRRRDDRIELISVQHFSAGGSFVVEVACSPPGGHRGPRGFVEPEKLRAQDINQPRPRLGSEDFPNGGDYWFVYGPRSYSARGPGAYESPTALAMAVIRLVMDQAEPWWRTRPFPNQ